MQPASGGASLTQVDIHVDDPDDSFATLQLGMDESYTLAVPAGGAASIRAPTVWGALRALETLAQVVPLAAAPRDHRPRPALAFCMLPVALHAR
jgi:hypothetical protein